ncbi:MAG: hypothetical protein L0229_15805 [Blastocatellia bacterium]|nr:hypothetical protein [Blastocatellia bacterium]
MEETVYKGKIIVKVHDSCDTESPIAGAPIVGARVYFYSGAAPYAPAEQEVVEKKRGRKRDSDQYRPEPVYQTRTNEKGESRFETDPGSYGVEVEAFGQTFKQEVQVRENCVEVVPVPLCIGFAVESFVKGDDCTMTPCDVVIAGKTVRLLASHKLSSDYLKENPVGMLFQPSGGAPIIKSADPNEIYVHTSNQAGYLHITGKLSDRFDAYIQSNLGVTVLPPPVQNIGGNLAVTLRRTATAPTTDLALWAVIRKSTDSISFNNYNRFMELVLCGIDLPLVGGQEVRQEFNRLRQRRFLPYNDTDAYRLLKVATEAFLMVNCGVFLAQPDFTNDDLNDLLSHMSLDRTIDINALNALWQNYLQTVNGTRDQTLPYLALIREKLRDQGRLKNSIFAAEDADLPEECFGILRTKLTEPCLLELIWSYWHEEGMLVQTMNALSNRFQNVRSRGDYDPLAMLEIDPLRPLNNLLWGHIQDEQHRLTVLRRAYEYDHHYGLSLYGKAVPEMRGADSRSKFLEAFHNLLYLTSIFFKEDDDTTVIADGFPLLNALREVHFLLTEGAHNQFGDLPSTARQEMLVQQWILARPEFREFLPTRIMVAYPEPWMDRVDAMKKLQGWTDVSSREFNALGRFGEQILLSIRFGAWSTVNDPMQGANWARFWRPEIQGYIHSYRAVTGVDMTAEVTDTRQAAERYLQPSVHLRNRLSLQQRQSR